MKLNVDQQHKLGTSILMDENPFPGEKISIQNNNKTIDKSNDINAPKNRFKIFLP